MTPTLLGRIQVRILLTLLVGVPMTALWSWLVAPWVQLPEGTPYHVLAALFVVGLILDPVYIWLQGFRWDRDWPFAFQFFFSIVEFLIVVGLLAAGVLEIFSHRLFPSLVTGFDDFLIISSHFALVFIPSFLLIFNGLPIFLIRWRFKGGELGRF